MALLVEQDVGGLLISVDDVGRVEVLGCLEQLVHDVLLVYVLEDGLAFDHVVQVGFHVLEDEVDVTVVVGLDDIVQLDDVRVLAEFLQENNLAVCSLKWRKKVNNRRDASKDRKSNWEARLYNIMWKYISNLRDGISHDYLDAYGVICSNQFVYVLTNLWIFFSLVYSMKYFIKPPKNMYIFRINFSRSKK